MAKSYSLAFISLFLLLFNSCQSIEQISIDYLQPADLSFPPQLRKVATRITLMKLSFVTPPYVPMTS